MGETGERREIGKEICGEKGGYGKERKDGDMTHRSQRMFLLIGHCEVIKGVIPEKLITLLIGLEPMAGQCTLFSLAELIRPSVLSQSEECSRFPLYNFTVL